MSAKFSKREQGKAFTGVTTDKLFSPPEHQKDNSVSFSPAPHKEIEDGQRKKKPSDELKSVYIRVDEILYSQIYNFANSCGISEKDFIVIAAQTLLEKGDKGFQLGLRKLVEHKAVAPASDKLKHFKLSERVLSEIIDPLSERYRGNRSSAIKAAVLTLDAKKFESVTKLILNRYTQFKLDYPD